MCRRDVEMERNVYKSQLINCLLPLRIIFCVHSCIAFTLVSYKLLQLLNDKIHFFLCQREFMGNPTTIISPHFGIDDSATGQTLQVASRKPGFVLNC